MDKHKTNKVSDNNEGEMSPEQIENFRQVLVRIIGPLAEMMPVEEIQRCKDSMQYQIDEIPIQ